MFLGLIRSFASRYGHGDSLIFRQQKRIIVTANESGLTPWELIHYIEGLLALGLGERRSIIDISSVDHPYGSVIDFDFTILGVMVFWNTRKGYFSISSTNVDQFVLVDCKKALFQQDIDQKTHKPTFYGVFQ